MSLVRIRTEQEATITIPVYGFGIDMGVTYEFALGR